MKTIPPLPTKINCINRLLKSIHITSVVDVGVRESTAELIQTFPNTKHYLFEPVKKFFTDIQKNYRSVDYKLFDFALSDIDSRIYLLETSLLRNGVVTHSAIRTEPQPVDGAFVVSCEPIDVHRFDSLDIARDIESNFLLKVDVDGQDLNVLKGFGSKISSAAIVIVECTYTSAMERISYVQSKGFSLVDLVDFVYYGDSLYQLDAVLVRSDLITSNLRPPIGEFRKELWSPVYLG
jgi:FkbM family methyltransferase